MAVQRSLTSAVVDYNTFTVTAVPLGQYDCSRVGCQNVGAVSCGYIYAGMIFICTVDRMYSPSEIRSQIMTCRRRPYQVPPTYSLSGLVMLWILSLRASASARSSSSLGLKLAFKVVQLLHISVKFRLFSVQIGLFCLKSVFLSPEAPSPLF